MLLLDICKYLQARTDVGEEITAGTLEESRTRCIGVYENRNLGAENRPRIGGLSCTKYFEKACRFGCIGRTTPRKPKKRRRKFTVFFSAYPM